MYDAGTSLGEALNIDESWLNLLNKKENSQSRSFRLWYQIGSYVAVALIAVAISSVFFFSSRDVDNGLYSRYIGGDGLEADVVELPDGTQVSLGSKTTFHYDKDFGKNNVSFIWKGKPTLM